MAKGLRNLPISFEELHPTHFAGMALIHWFCQKLGLKRLLLFAFDLVHCFQRLRLPPTYRTTTLKTVRRELLFIPGRLVNTDNRYRLKPPQYHFERDFRYALSKIPLLRPVQIR